VDYPDDPGLVAVLLTFGVTPDAVLGHGGEAWVYGLDLTRVLRVQHADGNTEELHRRRLLLRELTVAVVPPFSLPTILDIGEIEGRTFAIERRLSGESVANALDNTEGDGRARLIEAHLDAAAALGDLHLEPRDGYGDLIAADAITESTWRDYLEQRAAANLSRSVPELRSIDASTLAHELPEPDAGAFVHLDAFAGNMLTDGRHITAVIDIGPACVFGDRRFDPVSAAVYLAAPTITPTARPADIDVAMSWLRNARLDRWFEPVQRWLAGYWSFATDDAKMLAWCRGVLLGSS